MEVYAFIGSSGTGKSHNSQSVAYEHGIEYIIDDALLIKNNKVIAGRSAKTEPTKIGSVKSAIFNDPVQCDIMRKALKIEKPEKILILGTSDEMVEKIVENLKLPEIQDSIYIEDVSSLEQIEEAKKIRTEQGKHVVPVPTFEIKSQFSGYFMDQLKMFEKKDKVYREKSVIRPTFSYLGNYSISDKILKEIIIHEGIKVKGISKIGKVNIEKYIDGINIEVDINIKFGINIPECTSRFQNVIIKSIDHMTGINILSINIYVKGIDIEKNKDKDEV